MTSLRCPLASLTALVAYLAVHVGAAGLHHHPEGPPASNAPATMSDGAVYRSDPGADADDGDEHACPVCSVLHSAPFAPTPAPAVAALARAGAAVTPAATTRPHPLETAARPRAPPAV